LPARLFKVSLFLAMLCALPAHALTVEVDAPDEIRTLLTQHLEATRAARLGDKLDAEEITRLQQQSDVTARDLLETEGYFSPRVESRVERVGDDWRLDYRVDPGVRTTVRSVKIVFDGDLKTGADAAGLRGRIERGFSLKQGMPFRQADWSAAKLAILRPLFENTYPAARVAASEARIDPTAQAADLTLTIDSGPAFFYGEPIISGNQRYPVSIIRNLNPAKPGKPFRQQDLLDYQMALDMSGYYAQAVVRIEPDPAKAAAVPIRVDVVERPEKRFSIGAGLSTDTGARMQLGWVSRDIADRGLRLKLGVHIETIQQTTGVAELAWPRTSAGYENSLGVQVKDEDIEGQKTLSTLAAAKRTRRSGPIEATVSLQYVSEQQTIGDVVDEHNQALSANYAWTKRTDGRAFYPRRGYVLTLQGGGAAAALLSDTSFIRLYGRHTQYFPAGENGRLILRAELGGVLADTRSGIPTDFLFRAGGDNSVRGYAYQSLGQALAGGTASVRYLATGSAEYNYFFNRNWGMALFVDGGDAADSPSQLTPVFGYGLGARYRSPVGPVNLDLAYGEATRKFRLHFSLGVSF
jgi:translocation and assembly module TamA